MSNPRRPKDSPIRVEQGKNKGKRCKTFTSSADYTYSKTDDYKQRQALGLSQDSSTDEFAPDPKLIEALNKDLRSRNIKTQN